MNGTAARRSRSSSATNKAAVREIAPEMWLSGANVLPGRAKAVRDPAGLARQSAYVSIDFAVVCAAGATVFWLRFGLANPLAGMALSLGNLSKEILSASYFSFLMLYAGLVVLACMSQHLYRMARERTAWEESANTLKAVGFATALLVLFIFTSGNKEISRLVVSGTAACIAVALVGWRYSKRLCAAKSGPRRRCLSCADCGSRKAGPLAGRLARSQPAVGLRSLRLSGLTRERRCAGARLHRRFAESGAGAVCRPVVCHASRGPRNGQRSVSRSAASAPRNECSAGLVRRFGLARAGGDYRRIPGYRTARRADPGSGACRQARYRRRGSCGAAGADSAPPRSSRPLDSLRFAGSRSLCGPACRKKRAEILLLQAAHDGRRSRCAKRKTTRHERAQRPVLQNG